VFKVFRGYENINNDTFPYLLTRPEHSETKTETCLVNSIACESNTNRYVLFFYYTHEVND